MEVYVANAPGDDYDSEVPSGYDSWIGYWNKLGYPKNKKHARRQSRIKLRVKTT